MKKKIAILGSTGSIGKTLLDIINKDRKKFEIILLTADTNYKLLYKQAKKFNVSIEEVFDKMSEMVPLKRIGKPEEFGYLVAFLSSEYADYINGTNIPIDGGLLKSM